MAFDIRQEIFDDGECDDATFDAYLAELLREFARSPEGSSLAGAGWTELVADYARSYFGVTLPGLQPADFDEVMWSILPRKLVCDPAEAPEIIRELRAFWTYTRREFELPQAEECLGIIGEGAEDRMKDCLRGDGRPGIARSLMAYAQAAGLDIASPEGIAKLIASYNESLVPGTRVAKSAGGQRQSDAERKAKRKREKAARKRSRR